MAKRWIILVAITVLTALPFALRPPRPEATGVDQTLVILSPHNEAIRHEFAEGFQAWYRAKTGHAVFVDWRVIGGTSDIARYLEAEYVSSFRNHWTRDLGQPWSSEVQAGFQRDPDGSSSEVVRRARAAFMQSSVGCGIDLFFGGGPFDFEKQAAAGRLVDSGVARLYPESVIPVNFDGERYRDPEGRWWGAALSCYGILSNRDGLRRIGFDRVPSEWSDLADPRFVGEIGLCDPTKSGSMASAFECVVQQAMQRRVEAAAGRDGKALEEGWLDGLRLIQKIGANARYFTDASQKPPIDVASGDCAAAMCIDFYGREQQEAVVRRGGSDRLVYKAAAGGSTYSPDPIGLLRGAPHRDVAAAFIEYVLSADGQKLWDFRLGTPGGPGQFALRMLPVRRDFYGQSGWQAFMSDPGENPYEPGQRLIYHPERTGPLFTELAFIVRVMCEDTHSELVRAWKAILAAPEPRRTRALAVLQDLSLVDYAQARGGIRRALESRQQVDALVLARTLGDAFRQNYLTAAQVAEGR